MCEINYTSLSKALSKALRHRPERSGLALAMADRIPAAYLSKETVHGA